MCDVLKEETTGGFTRVEASDDSLVHHRCKPGGNHCGDNGKNGFITETERFLIGSDIAFYLATPRPWCLLYTLSIGTCLFNFQGIN